MQFIKWSDRERKKRQGQNSTIALNKETNLRLWEFQVDRLGISLSGEASISQSVQR